MKAVVVGAGIAGLIAARQLGLAGWEVEVLERSGAPRRDGYMMDFFGPGVQAAERIGLGPRLAQVAYDVQAAEYVNEHGRATASIDYHQFSKLAGGGVLSLLRPDLESVALTALDDVPAGRVRVRYAAEFTRAQNEPDRVRVACAGDGETIDADVLIGADGLHSAVRAAAFGPEPRYLRPLGMRAAAFIVHDPELNARVRGRFVLSDSIGHTAGIYGLRDDQVAAFLVYRHAAGDDPARGVQARLRRTFTGLGRDFDRLLEQCPQHPYDDAVAQIVMPRWWDQRTVLLGDAGGAVSLLAGQGGSLAVAGAALLGEVLGPVGDPARIGPALAEFERRWRPVVETAQASGRRAAASFLPANRARLLLRRWVLRATRLPGIDRLVARQIIGRIAK